MAAASFRFDFVTVIFLEVVREVRAEGQLATLDAITNHVGPAVTEHDITEALDKLVAEKRLRLITQEIVVSFDENTERVLEYQFYVPRRQSS